MDSNGFEYASTTSYYKKVVGGPNIYSYYASQCRGKFRVKVRNSTLIDISECNPCRKHDILKLLYHRYEQFHENV